MTKTWNLFKCGEYVEVGENFVNGFKDVDNIDFIEETMVGGNEGVAVHYTDGKERIYQKVHGSWLYIHTI